MKLHIFGASGTGVTTLGRALSEKFSIPYFDSDDYFWQQSDIPFTARRKPFERNALIVRDLGKQSSWILGGSVINWGEGIFPPFDLIVFLWLPAEIRLARLEAREFERYGNIVLEDPHRKSLYQAFMQWAADYDNVTGIANRNIAAHEQWLKRQTDMVIALRGDLTTEERINLIAENLAKRGYLNQIKI